MIEQIIVVVVTTAVGGLIGWLFARKKVEEQLKSLKIDNEIKLSGYYKKQLDVLIEENRKLQESNKTLAKLNRELLEELRKYKQLNGKSN